MINLNYYKDMWKWLTRDEDGMYNGIRDDAPEEIKRKYETFTRNYEEALKRGYRL